MVLINDKLSNARNRPVKRFCASNYNYTGGLYFQGETKLRVQVTQHAISRHYRDKIILLNVRKITQHSPLPWSDMSSSTYHFLIGARQKYYV